MKNKMQKACAMLLLICVTSEQINATRQRSNSAKRRIKTVAKESPAMRVNKKISILDQIVQQTKIIIDATGPKANKSRSMAKAELNKLMKELDPKIKDVINDLVESIKQTNAKNKMESKKAYDSLIALINSMDAQAKVISTIEEGRKAIQLAPDYMKQQVIAEQVQNVQAAEAQAEEAGIVSRVVGGIQSVLAMPGNYFFGEERTLAKTAFEAAVGIAVVATGAYATYSVAPQGTADKFKNWYNRGKSALGFAQEPQTIENTVQDTHENLFPDTIESNATREASKEAGQYLRNIQQKTKTYINNNYDQIQEALAKQDPNENLFPDAIETDATREASQESGQYLRNIQQKTKTYLNNKYDQAQEALSKQETGEYLRSIPQKTKNYLNNKYDQAQETLSNMREEYNNQKQPKSTNNDTIWKRAQDSIDATRRDNEEAENKLYEARIAEQARQNALRKEQDTTEHHWQQSANKEEEENNIPEDEQ